MMADKVGRGAAAIKECASTLNFLDGGANPNLFKSLPNEKQWLLAVGKWGFEGNEEMLKKALKNLPEICPGAANKAATYLEKIADDKKEKLAAFQKSLVERQNAKEGNNLRRQCVEEPACTKTGNSQKRFQHTQTIIPYKSWKS